MWSFSKDTILGVNQIKKYNRVLLTYNGNGKKKTNLIMCFPLHSGLQYSSICISRDSEKRPKYDEFIFESFCMGDRNYIDGTGI